MSTADAELPAAPRVEGPAPHLLVVRAPYYRRVVEGMSDGAERILREAGASFECAGRGRRVRVAAGDSHRVAGTHRGSTASWRSAAW